jgi:hypothetical protein
MAVEGMLLLVLLLEVMLVSRMKMEGEVKRKKGKNSALFLFNALGPLGSLYYEATTVCGRSGKRKWLVDKGCILYVDCIHLLVPQGPNVSSKTTRLFFLFPAVHLLPDLSNELFATLITLIILFCSRSPRSCSWTDRPIQTH